MSNRSRSSRTRRWVSITVASMALFQVQLLAASVPADAQNGACNGAFQGSPSGTLAMTASPSGGSTISAGQSITVTMTWNTGDWSGLDQLHDCVQINDVLDGALEYEEKPPANDGIAVHTFSVPANVADGDEVCARARLSGQPIGGVSTQKSNKLCWTVGQTPHEPDVKITKSASSTSVVSGDTVTFTLKVDNTGSGDALNVKVEDTIATGLTITGTSNGCSTAGQKVTCDLGTVSAGGSKSVTITVRATDGACPNVVNKATVSASNEPAGSTGNNTSNTVTIDVSCPTPDLKISKSSSTATVNVDGSVTFTLTVDNVGGATANNVVVTDVVPSGMTITAMASGCSASGQTVTCNLGDINAGGSRSATITVKATAAACPEITNDAVVTASNEPGSATGNNSSNVVKVNVVCPGPDVQIVKKSDAPVGGVDPGDSFTYTIIVENVGGATATDVHVSDTIPAGLAITGTSSNCAVSGQTVTCDLGDVAAGDKESVTITVEASEGACPDVTNHATVTAGNEPSANVGNNTSNDVTTPVNCVEPGIAVRITKTNDANRDGDFSDSEEARRPDADVPFLLVITNTGEAAWDMTDLTDAFDGQTIDLLDAKCADLQGVTLQPGESVTCRFTLNNYAPPADSPLTNTAEVCVQEMGGNQTDCDNDDSRVRSREVLGRTITPTKTPPGGTAFTGSNGTLGFGAIALALLLFGSGLMWTGYRRRRQYDS